MDHTTLNFVVSDENCNSFYSTNGLLFVIIKTYELINTNHIYLPSFGHCIP